MNRSPRKHDPRPDENSPEYLTYGQAAALLQISERTLWTMVNRGEVPHLKIGKSVRFCRESLDQWLKAQIRGGKQQDGKANGSGTTAGDGREAPSSAA